MDAKLNHSDLSALLAKELNISIAKSELFTKAFFDLIIDGLTEDGIVKINGLGTFKVTDVASRSSVDVNTGAKIEIKGHKKLTFTPADSLKEEVNRPFSMFEPVEVDDSYQEDETNGAENDNEVDSVDVPVVDVETVAVVSEVSADITTLQGSEENSADMADCVEVANVENAPEVSNETEVVADEPVADDAPADMCDGVTETLENEIGVVSEPVTVSAVVDEKNEEQVVEGAREKDVVEEKQTTPKKRKGMLLFAASLILGLAVGFFIIKMMGREHTSIDINAGVDTRGVETGVIAESTEETIIPATVPQPVDTLLSDELPVDMQSSIEDNPVVDTPSTNEVATGDIYPFVLVEELAVINEVNISMADTLHYVTAGEMAIHKVAENETLVKISRIYYGDKRLWPYLAKYNNLRNPNGLSKNMELAIPVLTPKK